jgi:hypothetical protein
VRSLHGQHIMGKPSDIFVVPSFELASAQRRAGGLAQQRAATTQTPRRPIGAGGVKGASRSGSASMITTRSLCAESPTQTEQWCCWLCRRPYLKSDHFNGGGSRARNLPPGKERSPLLKMAAEWDRLADQQEHVSNRVHKDGDTHPRKGPRRSAS